jgi:hypothetical protein
MLIWSNHSIKVFIRRISVEIEHRMPFHNPLKPLCEAGPSPNGPVVDRTKEWSYQRPEDAICTNDAMPLLAMLLFGARVGRALLFIACGSTEPSKGSVHKALEQSAPLSSYESWWLLAISRLKQVRDGLCKTCHPLVVEQPMPL